MKPRVYFDGLCPLCSREIAHYQRRDRECALEYIDISSPAFSAAAEGLVQAELERYFHVRGSDGKMYVGLDGFVKIWETVPGFRLLAAIGKNPVARPLLRLAYRLFARIRPYLPRRKQECGSDVCGTKEMM